MSRVNAQNIAMEVHDRKRRAREFITMCAFHEAKVIHHMKCYIDNLNVVEVQNTFITKSSVSFHMTVDFTNMDSLIMTLGHFACVYRFYLCVLQINLDGRVDKGKRWVWILAQMCMVVCIVYIITNVYPLQTGYIMRNM